MKNVDLGQVIAMIANLGVISSIAFLAFELRQNTQAVELASALSSGNGKRLSTLIRLARWMKVRASLWAADKNCSPAHAEHARVLAFEQRELHTRVRA